MDKQQCAGCGRSIGTGIASNLCAHCSINRQIRSESTELAAAKARIAELEKALEPFARFACDKPHISEHPCNNCVAAALLNKE